jgi:hypothetical protein
MNRPPGPLTLPAGLAIGLLLLLSTTGSALSPHPSDPDDGRVLEPDLAAPYRAVVVQPDHEGSVVAVSFHFPVGSAQDPEGQEGTAHLLGRALEMEGNRRLGTTAGRILVEVGREDFVVTLTASPAQWLERFRDVERLLRAGPVIEGDVERARSQHLSRLQFEEGAPVREFELERARILHGAGAFASRPPGGTPASIHGIPAGGPGRFLNQHLDPARATLAFVGPLVVDEVRSAVGTEVLVTSAVSPFAGGPGPGPAPPPATDTLPPGRAEADTVSADTLAAPPGPSPRTRFRDGPERALRIPATGAGAAAWSEAERRVLDRQLTSTWMAVAWPFPREAPRALLEFLARAIHEELLPSPPDPGLYGAEVAVETVSGTPVVMATATVDPRVTARWEERVLGVMSALADSPPTGAFFELLRRRFRNAVLLPLSDPERRSAWLARTLAREGSIPDLHTQIWALSREGLAEAAAAAGPPRVLLMGPEQMFHAR